MAFWTLWSLNGGLRKAIRTGSVQARGTIDSSRWVDRPRKAANRTFPQAKRSLQ